MAIKIIQHKQTPKELAYHFKCGCGCEFWSDSEGVLAAKSLDVILFYQTQCPEYGSHVESHDEPVLREEVLTIKMYDLWRADNERKQK